MTKFRVEDNLSQLIKIVHNNYLPLNLLRLKIYTLIVRRQFSRCFDAIASSCVKIKFLALFGELK